MLNAAFIKIILLMFNKKALKSKFYLLSLKSLLLLRVRTRRAYSQFFASNVEKFILEFDLTVSAIKYKNMWENPADGLL